jgi:large subunit ribosomal protein L17
MTSWIILLIIVIVIFIVWWALLRNAKTYKPDFDLHGHEEAAHAPEETQAETEPVAAEEAPPTEMAAPEEVQTDDLTVIEGIGPKINQLLHGAGIQTYAQLAAANVVTLRSILEPAGLHFIDPESWVEQAGLLNEGKIEDFEALKGRLRGGRRVS